MKKKKCTGLFALALMLLCVMCSAGWAKSPRDVVVDYAWEVYNFTWTADKPILLHNTNTWIPAGKIRGIPYTLNWTQNTFEDYKQLIQDNKAGNNNGLYNTSTYSIGEDDNGNTIWRTSMTYGMACAAFVTDCIAKGFLPDVSLPKDATTGFHKRGSWYGHISTIDSSTIWLSVSHAAYLSYYSNEYRAKIEADNYAALRKLRKGDYLDNWNHVILVVENDTSSGKIAYIDQTPVWDSNNVVGTHKGEYYYSSLVSNHYVPMYVDYPEPPSGIPIDAEHFPDSKFRECLKQDFDHDSDGYLSDSEIADAKVFQYTEYKGISSLDGIQYLANLEWLYIPDNHITHLNVSGMSKLWMICCWNNDMERIDARGCASLEQLWAGSCAKLKNVYIKNNPKMTLLYVDNCAALTGIYAVGSPQLSAFNLSGCSSLTTFERDSSVNLNQFLPTITTTSLPNGYVGENYSTTLKASGIGVITYSGTSTFITNGFYFTGNSNWYLDNTTGKIRGIPINTATRTYTFTVSNFAGSTSKNLSIAVTNRGKGPHITTSSLKNGTKGEWYSAPIAEEWGTLPITWEKYSGTFPPGLSLKASTERTVYLEGTPTSAGTYKFRIRAIDSTSLTKPLDLYHLFDVKEFTVTIGEPPSPLTINYTLKNATVGEYYSDWVSVSGGTAPYTWTKTSGTLPPGLNLSPSGSSCYLKGTPTRAGTYNFSLTVKDVNGRTGTKSFKIVVYLPINGTFPNGIAGAWYYKDVSTTGGTAPYYWTKTGNLPPGLSMSSSGERLYLKGTPTQKGTYDFTLTVKDAKGNSSQPKSFRIVITPPLVINWTFKNWAVGSWYSDWVTASGGTSPYTWKNVSGTLPPGLSLSPSGSYCYLKGTPTKAGTYTFKLRVTEANGYSITKEFTVKITKTTIGGTLPNGIRGAAYNGTLTASGGTAAYTWSIIKGTLPPGLGINKSTGKITGKPTKAGTYSFTVRLRDRNGITADKSYTIKVTQTTLTGTLPNGVRGAYYGRTLTAGGGTAPYTYEIISGTLPPGMKFDKTTGRIYGRPTRAGTFAFTVRARDRNGITYTKSFAIKVTQTTINYTFKAGTVGKSYSDWVSLSGGTSAYKITRTGTIPPGTQLTLSGTKVTLSGRPTNAGVYTFTLKATDKNNIAATKKFTIIIGRAAASAGTPDDEVPDEPDTPADNSTSDTPQDGIIWGRPVQDADGTAAAVVTLSLEVLSSDIIAQGTDRDSDLVEVRAGEPVTFIVSAWPEDASNVQVLVNDEAVDGVDISSEGTFTLPAEMVSGSFRVRAEAEAEGFTIETEELHITAEE